MAPPPCSCGSANAISSANALLVAAPRIHATYLRGVLPRLAEYRAGEQGYRSAPLVSGRRCSFLDPVQIQFLVPYNLSALQRASLKRQAPLRDYPAKGRALKILLRVLKILLRVLKILARALKILLRVLLFLARALMILLQLQRQGPA